MTKPTRLWVLAEPQPRVLVTHGQPPATVVPCLQIRVSRRCRGAELLGPWLLRAAVRIPTVPAMADAMPDPCAWIGALHARWLGYMGVKGTSTYHGTPVGHWAAFCARGRGDVTIGQRKIVDVTQIHRPGELLVVASTLLRPPPWALLCRTLDHSLEEIPTLASAATSAHAQLHGPIDEHRWAASLRSMLHLAMTLPQLRSDSSEGPEAGFRQECRAR